MAKMKTEMTINEKEKCLTETVKYGLIDHLAHGQEIEPITVDEVELSTQDLLTIISLFVARKVEQIENKASNAKSTPRSTKLSPTNIKLGKMVMKYLSTHGNESAVGVIASDLAMVVGRINDKPLNTQKLSPICSTLVEQGCLTKTVKKGIVYYTLTEQGQNEVDTEMTLAQIWESEVEQEE